MSALNCQNSDRDLRARKRRTTSQQGFRWVELRLNHKERKAVKYEYASRFFFIYFRTVSNQNVHFVLTMTDYLRQNTREETLVQEN